MILFVYMEHYIISIKENIKCQDSNEYLIIEKNLNLFKKIYIKIMRCYL